MDAVEVPLKEILKLREENNRLKSALQYIADNEATMDDITYCSFAERALIGDRK